MKGVYVSTLHPLMSPCQTLHLHIPVSRHSLVSGRRHLYKSEDWNFFFCVRSLVSGHLMHDNWLLVIKFVNTKFANKKNMTFDWATEQQRSVLSSLSQNTCRVTLCPHSPWSTFVLVSPVNGWRPLMRIILVDGLLYQQTLFSSPHDCPLMRELTLPRNCT